jgi:hypothetical protein
MDMTRPQIVRLLAEIDRHLEQSDSLSRSTLLTQSERELARTYREFFREAAARAEELHSDRAARHDALEAVESRRA